MNKPDDIISTLEKYLVVNGWPDGLTKKKLLERHRISSDESLPGWSVVTIERHRAILGGVYIPGQPMSAMQTYFMRYAVNGSLSVVNALSEVPEEIDVDMDGLVSTELGWERFGLSIEALDEQRFRLYENISHESEIVSNLEQAKAFVLTLQENYLAYFKEQLGMWVTDERQQKQLLSAYKERMTDALLEKAESVWLDRDL